MTQVQVKNAKEVAQKEEVKHKVGNYYLVEGSLYVLAATSYKEAMLVSLISGSRWRDGVEISSFSSITQEDFDEILGKDNEAIPVKSVSITYEI